MKSNIFFLLSLESPYIISPSGGLCSDSGDQDITTLQECEVAALSLNVNSPTSEDLSSYPKGCYIWGSSSVYFNTHVTGSVKDNARPICKPLGKFLMIVFWNIVEELNIKFHP